MSAAKVRKGRHDLPGRIRKVSKAVGAFVRQALGVVSRAKAQALRDETPHAAWVDLHQIESRLSRLETHNPQKRRRQSRAGHNTAK